MDDGSSSADDASRLHALLMDLARFGGLLQPDRLGTPHPLSLSQAFALHAVASDSALSQRDLAQLLQVDKSTVSRLAADLERDGLIERVRDPENHRQYRLRLTDFGATVARQMGGAMKTRFERWVAAMEPLERAALLAGLPALIRAVRESPE
jgi:DNA-binding MarR family transcriptional regulator